jgi:Pyridoxamine 5'-phosphate oxidase
VSHGPDPLTDAEKEYLRERDSFYLASVGETGWPYVQFRGGPKGFVHVLDDHTIGWADFRGNLQYISTGNVTGDDRVAIIAVDYAHQRRLKLFGHARIVTADEDAELLNSLADNAYEAAVERANTSPLGSPLRNFNQCLRRCAISSMGSLPTRYSSEWIPHTNTLDDLAVVEVLRPKDAAVQFSGAAHDHRIPERHLMTV